MLVTSLGAALWLLASRQPWQSSADPEQAQREQVMAQTRQFMLRMGTYGPDLLDESGAMPEYRSLVREVITPKFAASFDDQAGTAEQLVAQADVARESAVFATGVSDLDPDSATALVAGTFTDSYVVKGERTPQEPVPYRIEVSLVKIDGAWLVDDFTPGDRGRPVTAGLADAPQLYDLLDVAPDAGAADIRAAWKAAIADLDPSDRRFRAYNQAAELLLDPDRRAAYDAQLAPEEVVVSTSSTSDGSASVVDVSTSSTSDGSASATSDGSASVVEPVETSRRGPRTVPGWWLVTLALLTAAAVGVATWAAFAVPSPASVEGSTRTAQAAAERAIVPVLSYDAATLDEDQAAGAAYLTAGYREDYDQLYAVIRENAPEVGTVVTTEVVSSGIVRSGTDRVQVLVFVNRPTTNNQQKQPVVYRDQVTVTMQKVGDSWLVDDLVTSPPTQ